MTDHVVVKADALRSFVQEILQAAGMRSEPAAVVAETLIYADLRGDVYFAQGSTAEARAAYQSALEKTEVGSPYRNLIQIKIDALGQAK